MEQSAAFRFLAACGRGYETALKRLVQACALLAGLGVLAMMLITCLDVIMRRLGSPIHGAYDMVRLASVVAIACALPYTTAVKGHVAIEFFFQKLGRRGRILVDSLARLAGIGLFAILAWQVFIYGQRLRLTNEMMPTLGVPMFWMPYLISLCCALVALVILHNLMHPGKEMIKP